MNSKPDPDPRSELSEAAVSVRPARREDASAWLKLREALWPGADHAEEIARFFAHPTSGVILLAETDEGRVVGFAEVSVRRDWVEGCATSPVAYPEGLFVEPAFRRRGVARQLLGAVERRAKAEGLSSEPDSDTEIGNEASERFHGATMSRLDFATAFQETRGRWTHPFPRVAACEPWIRRSLSFKSSAGPRSGRRS